MGGEWDRIPPAWLVTFFLYIFFYCWKKRQDLMIMDRCDPTEDVEYDYKS